MKQIELPSGEKLPVLGMGTWNMGDRPAARAAELRSLRRGIELGMRLIDTAEMYGTSDRPHDNEELLGKALQRFRDRVVIATKFGISFDRPEAGGTHAVIPDSRPATIRCSVEESLHRLHTDRADEVLDPAHACRSLLKSNGSIAQDPGTCYKKCGFDKVSKADVST